VTGLFAGNSAAALAYQDIDRSTPGVKVQLRLGETVGTTGSNSATDLSGYAHPGTPTNVTFGTAGLISNNADTAATFNGSTSKIEIASSGDFNVTSGSVWTWFKTSTTGAYQELLRRDDGISNRQFLLRVDNTNKLNAVLIFGSFPGVTSAASVTDGVKHLAGLTWSYNGSTTTMTLYLDGVSVGTNTTSGAMPAVTAPLLVGAYVTSGTTGESLSGVMDEVGFASRDLAAQEFADRYSKGSGST
jgi:hypothetical protein